MRSSETAGLLKRLAVVLLAVVAVTVLVVVASRAASAPPQPAAAPPPAPVVTSSPPATTTPPPTTSSPPPCVPAQVPGVDDSAVGDFASHFIDDGSPGLVEGADVPRFVTGPDGAPGLEFSVPGGGKRSEVKPNVPPETEGNERWVHYVSTLHDVPAGTSTWQLVLQWHQVAGYGSPPLALEVGAGQLRLANQGAHQQSLGPIGPDDTIDVVLHVVFSTDPAHGMVEVWRDGRPVLLGYHPPGGTMLDARNYLKMGIYRDPSIGQASSMLVHRLVLGPTAASVGGTAGVC